MPPSKTTGTSRKASVDAEKVYEEGQPIDADEAADLDGPSEADLRASIRLNENALAASQNVPVAVAVKAWEDEVEAYRIDNAE